MLSMSLDGYFEGPRGEFDWHNIDEELHQHFNHVLAPMSVFIDGCVNYELMANRRRAARGSCHPQAACQEGAPA